MREHTERIDIAAAPEKIWDMISDVERHLELHGSGEIKALRVSGPMRAGATWEADERVRGAGSFTARSECLELDPPRTFGWRSYPPPVRKGNPDSVGDVRWWFRLTPRSGGTTLEHSVRIVEPKVGGMMYRIFYSVGGRWKAIRRGMRKTVENIKATAEA